MFWKRAGKGESYEREDAREVHEWRNTMKCPTCGHDHKGLMRLPKDIPLLPCPCCGGKAEFDDYDSKNGEVLVRCVDCDLNTVPRSHEEAAAQWNRRPS